MELQTRAAKEVIKRSRTKELQTGVIKGIANLGCKKELDKGVGKRNCRKELPNAVAQSQKDDEEACDAHEMQKITYFEAPLSDCFRPLFGNLHFSLFLMEACFQAP